MHGPKWDSYQTTCSTYADAKKRAHWVADQFERPAFVSPGIAGGYVVMIDEPVNAWYTAHPSSITEQWEQ